MLRFNALRGIGFADTEDVSAGDWSPARFDSVLDELDSADGDARR